MDGRLWSAGFAEPHNIYRVVRAPFAIRRRVLRAASHQLSWFEGEISTGRRRIAHARARETTKETEKGKKKKWVTKRKGLPTGDDGLAPSTPLRDFLRLPVFLGHDAQGRQQSPVAGAVDPHAVHLQRGLVQGSRMVLPPFPSHRLTPAGATLTRTATSTSSWRTSSPAAPSSRAASPPSSPALPPAPPLTGPRTSTAPRAATRGSPASPPPRPSATAPPSSSRSPPHSTWSP